MAPSHTSPALESTMLPTSLTPTQISTYHRDGYLILPSALSPETISALLSETHNLLTSFPLSTHPLTTFSTGETSSHVGDTYFLTSGDKIRFFFEEAAISLTSSKNPIYTYPVQPLLHSSRNPKSAQSTKSDTTCTSSPLPSAPPHSPLSTQP